MLDRMNDSTIGEWEAVLTVDDFYDCPRSGVAEYRGVPHAYQCEWDDETDDWSPTFALSAIDEEQLAIVKEAWAIWRRYQARFYASSLQPGDEHPALATDRQRHDELRPCVDQILQIDETIAIRVCAEFRVINRLNWPIRDYEVRWRPTE